MKKIYLIILAIIVISFSIGIYFYPQLPAEVASHWNAQGEVNGYLPKFWGLFLMPLVSLGLFLLLILIPKIDPLKANIEKFRKYFDAFVALIIVFLFYVYLLTIFWNRGSRFDMGMLLMPALAVLFYFTGVLIQNSKRNWFIGIRTPWTLSSDRVWEKTHKLGSKLFKASAILALIGMLFPKIGLYFVIIPVLFLAAFSIVYSYLEYKKETK